MITIFSFPEFDITKDLFENIDLAIESSQSSLPNDFKIALLYGNFDAYISTFTWFGMLKLSETFDEWIVLIVWVFFVFSKIGFFITINFIVLSLKDSFSLQVLKETPLKSNLFTFLALAIFFVLACFSEYTLQEKRIIDKIEKGILPKREIKAFSPNIAIDFKDINSSLNSLKSVVKREANPSLFGYQLTAINTRLDSAFEKGKEQIQQTLHKSEAKLNQELQIKLAKANQEFIASSQREDFLFQTEVKKAYQLKTTEPQRVYWYIFRND